MKFEPEFVVLCSRDEHEWFCYNNFAVTLIQMANTSLNPLYLHGPHGVARRALVQSGLNRASDGVKAERGGGERGVIGGVT